MHDDKTCPDCGVEHSKEEVEKAEKLKQEKAFELQAVFAAHTAVCECPAHRLCRRVQESPEVPEKLKQEILDVLQVSSDLLGSIINGDVETMTVIIKGLNMAAQIFGVELLFPNLSQDPYYNNLLTPRTVSGGGKRNDSPMLVLKGNSTVN